MQWPIVLKLLTQHRQNVSPDLGPVRSAGG